jgi:hypothetical protein
MSKVFAVLSADEALLGASNLRRLGVPVLAFWDAGRARWRFAVKPTTLTPVIRVDTIDQVCEAAGFVRPYPGA